MQQEPVSWILTRRHILTLAGAGLASRFQISAAGADFWNHKDPAGWSSEEIEQLMTRSPWAREVRAESSNARNLSNIGMGSPHGLRNRSGQMPSQKMIAPYKGTVLWESARPIRDALKTPLPDELAGQYVLSVNDIPLSKSESANDDDVDGARTASRSSLDKLKALTTLQVKGKDPIEAGVVQQQTGNGAVYLFGFPKEALAIAKDDKEVVFETHMGKLVFTARFTPREMLYHSELAVLI
jgi:hypothetical protein